MKMTVKEFKELMSADDNELLDEGLLDFFRKKKPAEQEPSEQEPSNNTSQQTIAMLEDFRDLYDDMKSFASIVKINRDEVYDLSVIETRLDLIDDIKANRGMSESEKQNRIKKHVDMLRNKLIPELLQSLANNYGKSGTFKKTFDDRILMLYGIKIPEVKMTSTKYPLSSLPEIVDSMIEFASSKGYKKTYMNKLNLLKRRAIHLSSLEKQGPEALSQNADVVENLVTILKNTLRAWRRKFDETIYNELPYNVKKFALNENKKKRG